jgi:AraC-like DNA-binding protein
VGVIVTLLPNPGRLQRLRAAVRERHAIEPCDSWAAVTRVCESSPVHLAVVDLYADGAANFERIRVLRARFPKLALVAYVGATADRAHDLFDAGRVGFEALIVADVDDAPSALLALVERAEARSAGALLRAELSGARPIVRDAAMAAVTRAHERLTPEALARLLLLPRRVLAKRLEDAGFPPPHRLITWGRLIVAAHMLEDANRSADGVANALDFPSGSAFRNTCQRYLRSTPQQIRASGGAQFVTRALADELRMGQPRAGAPTDEPGATQGESAGNFG